MSAPGTDVMHLAEVVADWPWSKIGLYTLGGVGAVALLTATSLTALVVGLAWEDRRIRRNREHTTGIRGALDKAATR